MSGILQTTPIVIKPTQKKTTLAEAFKGMTYREISKEESNKRREARELPIRSGVLGPVNISVQIQHTIIGDDVLKQGDEEQISTYSSAIYGGEQVYQNSKDKSISC